MQKSSREARARHRYPCTVHTHQSPPKIRKWYGETDMSKNCRTMGGKRAGCVRGRDVRMWRHEDREDRRSQARQVHGRVTRNTKVDSNHFEVEASALCVSGLYSSGRSTPERSSKGRLHDRHAQSRSQAGGAIMAAIPTPWCEHPQTGCFVLAWATEDCRVHGPGRHDHACGKPYIPRGGCHPPLGLRD